MEEDYLTRQSPLKALLFFSLPMMLGNIFQQLYTITDSAVVGRYVGEGALAAIGASHALSSVFVCVAVGGGLGASVLVSHAFGAKRYKRMKRAVHTSLSSFIVLGLLLAAFGAFFCRELMESLRCPAELLDEAAAYLRIYFLGLPFLFLYSVTAAMFNALGKSKIPLYFLIASSLGNILLDVLLVKYAGMGVRGVAWASFAAQGLAALCASRVLLRQLRRLSPQRAGIFSRQSFGGIARLALPSIIQQSIVSLGMLLVQTIANSFGAELLAGYSAAIRIESLCVVPMLAFGAALSAYTAQNLGARQAERVPQGYRAGILLSCLFGAGTAVALFSLREPLIAFFLGSHGSATALRSGCSQLAFMAWFYALIGFKVCVDGLLRGAADLRVYTLSNLANLGLRLALAAALAPHYGICMVWVSVPAGWFLNWAISYWRYRVIWPKIAARAAAKPSPSV